MLSGRIATDHSYASGLGAYDLQAGDYSDYILAAAGLDRSLFPKILSSTEVIGEVRPEIAARLGLPPKVRVVAGGVDNSCMALGARTFREGDIYSSMGSSSWLTIASAVRGTARPWSADRSASRHLPRLLPRARRLSLRSGRHALRVLRQRRRDHRRVAARGALVGLPRSTTI